MIRKYGNEPFKAAVIHGGPGACGSLACMAKELSKTFGILEPIQSKYTISDLIEELHEQINGVITEPITLIGHSWGAWLVILYAARYPQWVKQIALVGSGPLKSEYAPRIAERRLNNLPEKEAELFQHILSQLNNEAAIDDATFKKFGALADKSDNYDTFEIQEKDTSRIKADRQAYALVWPQADKMRSSGELIRIIKQVKCPVIVIHGEYDSHPPEGVIEPLKELGIAYEAHILPKCGHSPYKEKMAVERFYEILCEVIVQTCRKD